MKETQESKLQISNLNSAAPKRRRSSRGEVSQEASHHHIKALEEEYTTNLEEYTKASNQDVQQSEGYITIPIGVTESQSTFPSMASASSVQFGLCVPNSATLEPSLPSSGVAIETVELEGHSVEGVPSFAVGQVVELLHKDNSEEVVGRGTILALLGAGSFHTLKTKKDHYRINVFQAIDESAPLMEPNMADDPPQILLGQAVGTSTLWRYDCLRALK